MHLLLALTLLAAPTNSPDDCDKLWDDTVTAAAPDLDPSDDLRKSYLSHERAMLEHKCASAGTEVMACPARASKECSARFPQPADGGRAFGLATCVWPEVQACVQEAYLRASGPAIDALLANLELGKLTANSSGLVGLIGSAALLSVRGQALVQRAGKGFWLALVTRRAGARVDAVVFASRNADKLPATPTLAISGLSGRVVGRCGAGVSITTAR